MNAVLVDTNVMSYAFKRDTRAANYYRHLENVKVCLSFVTVAELYLWTIERSWGERRIAELKALLATCVLLPHDDETSWNWASVRSTKGRPVSASDAWIAATALRHDLPLVTHNRRNFENIPGLKLVSESV